MSRWSALGAFLAGLAVMVGAFGAHALKARVTPELLTVFETGNRYHMYHALGLMLLGALEPRLSPRALRIAGIALTAGILLFSGSLYIMTLTGIRALGMITPLGGVAFMVGWFVVAGGLLRR